jgi:LacI family transcriptional regulator
MADQRLDRVSHGPNMRDVAAAADVSVSAVSLVLNGKPGVGQAKRARVLQAMKELGYVHAGRGNDVPEMRVLGLLMETLSVPASDGFYPRIVAGIEDAAHRLGYHVLLHRYRPGVDPINDMGALMGRDVDGLIIASDGDITDEMIRDIAGRGTPVVLVEAYVAEPIHAVLADNFTAGLTVTKHLIDLGHRRIAALPGSSKYSSLNDRLRGHAVALLEHGLPLDPALRPAPVRKHPRKGYVQMQQLLALPEPPTAVFAVSDKSALGAIEAIKEAGLRIPYDISIASIDDVAESAYSSPPLTTFHVPKYQLGETSVTVLHRLLTIADQPPAKTVLLGHLVVRQSCAAPPEGA